MSIFHCQVFLIIMDLSALIVNTCASSCLLLTASFFVSVAVQGSPNGWCAIDPLCSHSFVMIWWSGGTLLPEGSLSGLCRALILWQGGMKFFKSCQFLKAWWFFLWRGNGKASHSRGCRKPYCGDQPQFLRCYTDMMIVLPSWSFWG